MHNVINMQQWLINNSEKLSNKGLTHMIFIGRSIEAKSAAKIKKVG